MRGDNFRMADPETAAWALAQFMALQHKPIERPHTYSHLAAYGAPDKRIEHGRKHGGEFAEISVPSARKIASEVAEKHGLTLTQMGSLARKDKAFAARAKLARYEFWARCKAEITICGAPASWQWIAALTGNNHATVLNGARRFRNRSAA